jgi:uncharacterized protein (DUF1015 family)
VVRQECALERVVPLVDPPRVPAQRPPRTARDAYDDLADSFYVYRLRRGAEEHTGVVGELAVEAFAEGRVRGHEAVHPDRLRALVDHYAAGGERTGLVALLHPPATAVARATALAQDAQPVLRFTAEDGWEQTVWALPDAATSALAEALDLLPLYVADGHHRVAASLRRWEEDGRPSGVAVMCALYPFGNLRMSAFHRRVRGPVAADALWEVLGDAFDVRPVPGSTRAATFDLYLDGSWYVVARVGDRSGDRAGDHALDAAVLDREVLEPLLGAEGRAAGLEISPDVGDLTGLTTACDRDGGALFVLRPPSLDQLLALADRGEVMPPKTTYFAPKPYAGVFLQRG